MLYHAQHGRCQALYSCSEAKQSPRAAPRLRKADLSTSPWMRRELSCAKLSYGYLNGKPTKNYGKIHHF